MNKVIIDHLKQFERGESISENKVEESEGKGEVRINGRGVW